MSRVRGAMILEDGPAAGNYTAMRAPHFLRAVVSRSDGRVDLLDQLHDEPRPIEAVFVYEAEPGSIFDPDTLARTGTFLCPRPAAAGRYRHRVDAAGATVRTTGAWRAWARAQIVVGVDLIDGITLEPVVAP